MEPFTVLSPLWKQLSHICSVKQSHYVFPMNQKCTELECKGPWFCHWFFEFCVLKQIFRDPVLHCWNGSNEFLVHSIIAAYRFAGVKLCLFPSLLLAVCGKKEKIISCSAGPRSCLWASALLPTNAGPKLQPRKFSNTVLPLYFPFSS